MSNIRVSFAVVNCNGQPFTAAKQRKLGLSRNSVSKATKVSILKGHVTNYIDVNKSIPKMKICRKSRRPF